MMYFFDWESAASICATTSSCEGLRSRKGKLSSSFLGASRPKADPQLGHFADLSIPALILEPHAGQNFNEQGSSTGSGYKLTSVTLKGSRRGSLDVKVNR